MLSFALGILIGGAAWPVAHRHLRTWQDGAERNLIDEVQWAFRPTEDLVANKDGSYLAIWELSGPDLTLASDAVSEIMARQAQRLLDVLDGDHMLHVDDVRLKSTSYTSAPGKVPAPALACDLARRALYDEGRHYENRTFLSLTYRPPQEAYRKATRLFFSGGQSRSLIDRAGEAEDFGVRTEMLIDLLPSSLKVRRLAGAELLGYLRGCITGDFGPVGGAPAGPHATLDPLFSEGLSSGFEPYIGGEWVRLVGVQGYPETAHVGITSALERLPFEYRYSNRIIGVSAPEAQKLIKKRRASWIFAGMSLRDLFSTTPPTESQQADFAREALEERSAQQRALDMAEVKRKVDSGEASLAYHTAVVVVRHRDLATCNERARRVEKALRSCGSGFATGREEGLATEALIGSWPGHGSHNVRRYPLLTDYATRLLPLTSTYPGPKTTPSKLYAKNSPPLFYASTEQLTPYRYSSLVGGVGHTIFIGPTGMGKSVILSYQAMRQLHYEGGRAVLLDNGYSFAPVCAAMGGTHYDVGADVRFNPLWNIGNPEDRRWASGWVEGACRLRGLSLSARQVNDISDSLRRLSENDPSYWTLQELRVNIQDPDVKAALKPFGGDGELGMLLNGTEDGFKTERFQVIELSKLLNLDPAIFTPVLTFLFHRIFRTFSPEQPTSVSVDEFAFFAAKTPEGRESVMDAFRTWRKSNAFMSVATQDPKDMADGPLSVAIGSASTTVYLPNPKAKTAQQRPAYEALGLSEKEITLIAEGRPQRDYIVQQPAGTRKIDLGLGPELAFLTAAEGLSLQGTAEQMRSFKDEHGEDWVAEWLRYRGMAAYAPYAEAARRRGRLGEPSLRAAASAPLT